MARNFVVLYQRPQNEYEEAFAVKDADGVDNPFFEEEEAISHAADLVILNGFKARIVNISEVEA